MCALRTPISAARECHFGRSPVEDGFIGHAPAVRRFDEQFSWDPTTEGQEKLAAEVLARRTLDAPAA